MEIWETDELSHEGKRQATEALMRDRLLRYERHPYRLLWWTLRWKLGL